MTSLTVPRARIARGLPLFGAESGAMLRLAGPMTMVALVNMAMSVSGITFGTQ